MQTPPVSREWEISCALREIMGRLVRGLADHADMARMNDLMRERSDRMLVRFRRVKR